jgi:hypothetical protein
VALPIIYTMAVTFENFCQALLDGYYYREAVHTLPMTLHRASEYESLSTGLPVTRCAPPRACKDTSSGMVLTPISKPHITLPEPNIDLRESYLNAQHGRARSLMRRSTRQPTPPYLLWHVAKPYIPYLNPT